MGDGKGKGKGKGKEVSGKSAASKRKSPFLPDDEKSGSRKQRRSGVLQFFDDVADVTDIEVDVKSDNDSDDDGTDFQDKQILSEAHQVPFFLKEETDDAEIERFLRQRYKKGSKYVVHAEEARESEHENSTTQLTGDAIIWKVKCARGHERKVVVCLIQKFINLQSLGNNLCIRSAFCVDHIKGFICIEADRQHDIIEACKGLFGIYANTASRIPCSELPHLLSVRGKSMEIIKDMWVRVKFGIYKGDLAKVIDVDDARRRATIKLIPRVDLQAVVDKTEGKTSVKKAAAPAPRLISSYELEKLRQFVNLKRDRRTGEVFEVIDGLMLKDGYLYKRVRLDTLDCWDVQPSDVELERFKGPRKVPAEDPDWISRLYGQQKKRKAKEVNQRDKGKASSSFDPNEVKEWELFDLVLLEKKGLGVIIGIDGNNFQILKGNCERLETTTMMMHDIKQHRPEEKTFSLDRNSNKIFLNDIVKVLEGPFEGKQGIVKHILQGILFIYDNNQTEANGFSCARPKSCEAIKYSSGPSVGNIYGSDPPGFEAPASLSSLPQPEGSPVRRREYPRTAGRTGDNMDGQFYIGQTVRIRVGPLKGYLCRVIGSYRSDVTVKLDSQFQVIKVKTDELAVVVARGYGHSSRDDLSGLGSASRWEVGEKENVHQANLWNWTNAADLSVDNKGSGAVNLCDNWNMETVKGQQSGLWDEPTVDRCDLGSCWNQGPGTTKGSGETWGGADNSKSTAKDAWDQSTTVGASKNWGSTNDVTGSVAKGWSNTTDQTNKAEAGPESQVDSWIKASHESDGWGYSASQWNKTEATVGGQTYGSGKGTDCLNSEKDGSQGWDEPKGQCEKAAGASNQVDNWGNTAGDWNKEQGVTGSHGYDWGKPSGEHKVEVTAGDQAVSYDKALGVGKKEKDVNGSQDAGWNEPTNNWNKPKVAAGDCWGKSSVVENKERGAGGVRSVGWNPLLSERNEPENAEWSQADCWAKGSSNSHKVTTVTGDQSDGWAKLASGWSKPEAASHNQVNQKASCSWSMSTSTDASISKDAWIGGSIESSHDADSWHKPAADWSESKAVGSGEHGDWKGSKHGGRGGSDQHHMERAPGRGRGRGDRGRGSGRWNRRDGEGDSENNCGSRTSNFSLKANSFGEGGGWQKTGGDGGGNQSGQWKQTKDPWETSTSVGANQAAEDLGKPHDLCQSQSQSWNKTCNASGSQTGASTSHAMGWNDTKDASTHPKATWDAENSKTSIAADHSGKAADGWGVGSDDTSTRKAGAWGEVKDGFGSETEGWDRQGNPWSEGNVGGMHQSAKAGSQWNEPDATTKDKAYDDKGLDGWNPGSSSGGHQESVGWDSSAETSKKQAEKAKFSSEPQVESWDKPETTSTKQSPDGSSNWKEASDGLKSGAKPISSEWNNWGNAAAGGWSTGAKPASCGANSSGNAAGGWNTDSKPSPNASSTWGKASDGWKSGAKMTSSESTDWGSAAAGGSWTKPTSDESNSWAKASGGWNKDKDSSGDIAKDDWQNSAPKSWGKGGSWQQSADQGPQSNTGECERWSRPSFGDRGQLGYRGRGRGPRGGGRGWDRSNEDGHRPGRNEVRGTGGGGRGWNRNNEDGDRPGGNGGRGGRGGRGWNRNDDGDRPGWNGGRGPGGGGRGWKRYNNDGDQPGGDGGRGCFHGEWGWSNNDSGDRGRGRGRGGRGWNNDSSGRGRGWMENNDDRDKLGGYGRRGPGGSSRSWGSDHGDQTEDWQKSGNSINEGGSQPRSWNQENRAEGVGQQSSPWSTWASAGGSSEKANDGTGKGWGYDGDHGTDHSREPANSENQGVSSLPAQSIAWTSWDSAAGSSSKANDGSRGNGW